MDKLKWIPLAVISVVVMMITLMFISLLPGSHGGTANSNGKRIYFTATNNQGKHISYTGGPAFGGMMMMGQLSCASCHGADGNGRQFFLHMQPIDAPNINWAGIADLDTFRSLVVDGKHANGEPLSIDMPRWNLNAEDMADLADFISILAKGENNMFPGGYMMGGWWMIFPILGFLLIFVMMFVMMNRGGFLSGRNESRGDQSENQDSESALDILKKRYAKGEISKEEFDRIREDL